MSKQAVHWILIVPALLSAVALAPARAPAEAGQLNAQVDLEYIHSNTERENEDETSPAFGEEIDTTFSWFKQRYKLELRKELYPYLNFLGGGYLELIDSRTDTRSNPPNPGGDGKSGYDERADRLFAELDLDNPLYTASGAYRRRNLVHDPRNGPSERLTRDEIAALWHWRPIGFPSLDLDFSRFHTWDDRDILDRVTDLLVLKSRYNYEDFASDYTYTRSDRDERIQKNGSLTQVHNGGLRYPKSFLDDRLEITGAVRFNYETLTPQEAGDVLLPTTSPGIVFFCGTNRTWAHRSRKSTSAGMAPPPISRPGSNLRLRLRWTRFTSCRGKMRQTPAWPLRPRSPRSRDPSSGPSGPATIN